MAHGKEHGVTPFSMVGFGLVQAGKLHGLPGYSLALPHAVLSLIPPPWLHCPSGSSWIMSSSFLPLGLHTSYLIGLEQSKNTISLHNDVAPSSTSFRSLVKAISSYSLSKNASPLHWLVLLRGLSTSL